MSPIAPLPHHTRAIANWLLVCIMLVTLMVFIGGVTRLTESGLSIVEWKLVSGTLPPLSEAGWQKEFAEYQTSPQFKQVNVDFTVADFKRIYWLEYLHRLLGRIIGLSVLLPWAYFLVRRQLPRRLALRGLAIGALVGAQGMVGWVMVASGLVDQPRVEPIKLAAHLLLAFAVLSLMLWTRWQVLGQGRPSAAVAMAWLVRAALALLVIQIFFGALVAGLRAGWTYNTWPLMDGRFIPEGLHLLTPWWKNHLENVLTVQFQHRLLAYGVVAVNLFLACRLWRHAPLQPLARVLVVATVSQLLLGVATLLSHVQLALASAHQLLALGILAILVRLMYLSPLDASQRA